MYAIEYKEERYLNVLKQIKGLLENETNLIANMANISAVLFSEFKYHWVGFYLVDCHELVLGPFQGPVACTRITKGRGVCGTAWEQKKTQLVGDVNEFPGHIACSPYSCSEIVVPVFKEGEVIAVLDIDSENFDTFDEVDVKYLTEIVALL